MCHESLFINRRFFVGVGDWRTGCHYFRRCFARLYFEFRHSISCCTAKDVRGHGYLCIAVYSGIRSRRQFDECWRDYAAHYQFCSSGRWLDARWLGDDKRCFFHAFWRYFRDGGCRCCFYRRHDDSGNEACRLSCRFLGSGHFGIFYDWPDYSALSTDDYCWRAFRDFGRQDVYCWDYSGVIAWRRYVNHYLYSFGTP